MSFKKNVQYAKKKTLNAMPKDRPLLKIKWCNNRPEAEHVRTRRITSLLLYYDPYFFR